MRLAAGADDRLGLRGKGEELVAVRPTRGGETAGNGVFADLGPGQVGPAQVGPVQVGPGQVGPVQVGPVQVGPNQVGPGQVGPAQIEILESQLKHISSVG